MTQTCKSVSVMDTDTLLYSFGLECPPKKVIDRIDQQFDIFLPEKVFQEYQDRILKGTLGSYNDVRPDIDFYFSRKRREGKLIPQTRYAYCLRYVRRYFSLIGRQTEFMSLDDGEKHCIALGLHLSRTMRTCIIMLSDDFRALDAGIGLFICETCLGSVHPLLEVMIFLYCISRDIPEFRLRTIITDYFLLNKPKHERMLRFREEIIKEIDRSCRHRNNWRCELRCLA